MKTNQYTCYYFALMTASFFSKLNIHCFNANKPPNELSIMGFMKIANIELN